MMEKNVTAADLIQKDDPVIAVGLSAPLSSLAMASIAPQTQGLLLRMFSDPQLLEKSERGELVNELRCLVNAHPQVSELRVLLGMALCVNFDAQAAIEELRESVRLSPNSFIAQLKFGELWMRLRVMDQAEEHTRLAGLLVHNAVQSELARRLAATIRTMKREGIERGGYQRPWTSITGLFRRLAQRPYVRRSNKATVALDVN